MTLVLRAATADDSRDLWLWRNNESTRRNSRTTDEIAWETHVAWFARMLASRDSLILIAEEGAARVGTIRFDRIVREAVGPPRFGVSIMVAPAAWGRGVGHVILRAGCDYLRRDQGHATVLAAVKHDNVASRRIFEAAGFVADDAAHDTVFSAYLKHLS